MRPRILAGAALLVMALTVGVVAAVAHPGGTAADCMTVKDLSETAGLDLSRMAEQEVCIRR